MANMFDSEESDEESSSTAAKTSVDDLINFARQQSGEGDAEEQDWAKPVKENPLQPGTVLVANPLKFCEA
ncbi:MAG: hypothetical protein SGARI_005452, partial [Bacillariaceae sp.]